MWLRLLTGDRAGHVVRVRGERFVVGGGEGCDLVLNDALVADEHAAFERAPDGAYALVDLGSEGGTFVKTRRLRGRVELEGDEELCFGETFARLSTSAPRARRAVPVALAGLGLVLAVGAIALLATRVGGSPEAVSEVPLETEVATEVVTEFESVTVTVGPEGGTEAAPTEPPPATEPAPEEAQAVSFTDDFSDPATGWEVFANAAATAGYENGEYVMRILDSAFYATADSGRRVEDAVVSVTAHNPARTTNAGFGVICRYRGADDYYVLAIGADGSAAILRREEGELRVLTGGGAWLRSPQVAAGAERYELVADCRGDRLRLSVDGARVVSAPSRSPAGRVGLFAAGPAEIRFDDFAAEQRA